MYQASFVYLEIVYSMRRSSSTSNHADYVFLGYAAAIILFGLLLLSSAGVAVGLDRFDDAYFFIKRQLLFGFLPGLVAFFIASKIRYDIWKQWSLPIFILSIILLILVFIPAVGSTNNTFAKSWLTFGAFTFQPIEAAKLALIIYISGILSTMGDKLREGAQGFISVFAIGLLPIALVALQPDTGGMFILGSIIVLLLFFARAKLMHLVIVFLLGILAFGVMIVSAPYRAERFMTFLHPELDPQGQGYQINQAFLAIGSGGWFGLGLGHSRQKFQYLPEVQSDSIFAVAGEELGFVVIIGFLIVYTLFMLRGFKIAREAPDEFGRLLVLGIMSWFVVQTFMNVGAMVGIMPLTGVPLPFVSHGGTALMIGMAALGIVANVSKRS